MQNYKALQVLLENGAKITNEEHGKYLIQATYDGRGDILEIMLENGIDANYRCNKRETALFIGVRMKNYAICKQLIEYGADINIKNVFGISPQTLVNEQNCDYLTELFSQSHKLRILFMHKQYKSINIENLSTSESEKNLSRPLSKHKQHIIKTRESDKNICNCCQKFNN